MWHSHLLHMLVYATLVSCFFAVLVRQARRERLRLGAILWGSMVGGALALAYLMYPFPGLSALRVISLWGPVALFMIAIHFVSARETLPLPPRIWDKGLHTAAYAVLGVLALRAFHGGIVALRSRPAVCAMLLTVLYGLADEWHQSRVPGRHASGWDWIADSVGALAALLLFTGVVAWRSRVSRSS